MKKIRIISASIILWMSLYGMTIPTHAQGGRADEYLQQSAKSISQHVGSDIELAKGTSGLLNYIDRILDILVPLIITLGIAIAMYGGYKMMASNKEEALKEGGSLVLYGVIGIIVIVSARFLTNTLVDSVIQENLVGGLHWIDMATSLYEKMLIPFLKLAAYLSMGALFFILAGRVFSFLTSNDEGVRKKAVGMIWRTVIWILIIMAAKQIVEAVFGRRHEVLNQNADTLGDIWTGIFEAQNIPIIYEILNRVMGLSAFVVLILIIFQTFQMLTKPDDPEVAKKIKKTLLYVAIWVIVIGTGYIISNVLLIN